MTPRSRRPRYRVLAVWLATALGAGLTLSTAFAQTPAAPAADAAPADSGALAALAWLAGCWQGSVNQREFREVWLPLRGGIMVGVSHTLTRGRSQGFEYLRLEQRGTDAYYVAAPSGKAEAALRLSSQARDVDDDVFTFTDPARAFPQTIVYRRAPKGWLYAHVEGTLDGAARKVIYPMRRIDCESGELIEK